MEVPSNVHHHHVFRFNDDDESIYFDGAVIHDHDALDHWDQGRYAKSHSPLGGLIDDGRCIELGGCRWSELIGEET